jgi:hypothetical protein
VLCLAFAVVASSLTVRSLQTLRLAKAELERTLDAQALDGAQLAAAAAVIRDGGDGPFAWTFSTDRGWVQAVAEPEDAKLRPAAFAALDERIMTALGVRDAADLKARIAAIDTPERGLDLADMDAAPLWRDCGPSIVSPFGGRDAFVYTAHRAPAPNSKPPAWRIGEAWRIQIATATGWRDERIVRFTGNAQAPAAVVSRRLSRGNGGGGQCEGLLSGVVAG